MSEEPVFGVSVARGADEAVVHCTGRLDSNTYGGLNREVKALIPASKRIVLDLTGVTYMDSSGLGTIAGLYVSMKRHGGQLDVVNLSPRVRELFSMTRLLSLFEPCGESNVRIV